MAETIDYVPFMDRYPELKLRPVTEFQMHPKISGYDYVQDLKLQGSKAPHGCFYLTVKDAKFGVYMFDSGFFFDTSSIVLRPQYDSIEIVSHQNRSCVAIICKEGMYGMYFWTYGSFFNDTFTVPTEYNELHRESATRYKAVKGNQVVYLDATGHVLK